MYPNEKFFAHSERFDSGHIGLEKAFDCLWEAALSFSVQFYPKCCRQDKV